MKYLMIVVLVLIGIKLLLTEYQHSYGRVIIEERLEFGGYRYVKYIERGDTIEVNEMSIEQYQKLFK